MFFGGWPRLVVPGPLGNPALPSGGISARNGGPGRVEPTFTMISTDTLNHIENIKKRAGHLWRFL